MGALSPLIDASSRTAASVSTATAPPADLSTGGSLGWYDSCPESAAVVTAVAPSIDGRSRPGRAGSEDRDALHARAVAAPTPGAVGGRRGRAVGHGGPARVRGPVGGGPAGGHARRGADEVAERPDRAHDVGDGFGVVDQILGDVEHGPGRLDQLAGGGLEV